MSAVGFSLKVYDKTKTNKQANDPSSIHEVTWHPATEVLNRDVFLPLASYWSTNSDREYMEPHIKKNKKKRKKKKKYHERKGTRNSGYRGFF